MNAKSRKYYHWFRKRARGSFAFSWIIGDRGEYITAVFVPDGMTKAELDEYLRNKYSPKQDSYSEQLK